MNHNQRTIAIVALALVTMVISPRVPAQDKEYGGVGLSAGIQNGQTDILLPI